MRWALGIAALVWSFWAVGQVVANAQVQRYDAAYVRQAKDDIERIEAAYDAARDYWQIRAITVTQVQAGHADLVNLAERLTTDTVPVQAAGVQQQLTFAVSRCQNYVPNAQTLLAEEDFNVFVELAEMQLREYCAVQIHATKMRLIDYGVANGVNVYAK